VKVTPRSLAPAVARVVAATTAIAGLLLVAVVVVVGLMVPRDAGALPAPSAASFSGQASKVFVDDQSHDTWRAGWRETRAPETHVYDDATTRAAERVDAISVSVREVSATKAGGGGAGAADDIFEPLSGVNPSGSTTNCVRCVGAARDTLNGTPRVAGPGAAVVPDEVLGQRSQWGPSVDDVAGQLTSPGSHGIVQVPSATQPSHMLTVINEGGTIRYVDPQAGGAIVPTPSEIWGYWPG
jgi:hypothetical protein